MSPPIHVLKPYFRVDEVLLEIRECLEAGWTGMGFKTEAFEKRWCEYTGMPHAHFLNSATAGLHLALAAYKHKLGWVDGDEIITTAVTFVSTNHAILYEGLTPVFADIDSFGCIAPEQIEALITSRTRGVLFVGLGGSCGQLEQVAEICRKHNLKLVLDAAHLAGARLKGRDPGHLADVTVYSFQAVKNLPTADSGMICYHDAEYDKYVRQLSWLGIDQSTQDRSRGGTYKWRYDVPDVGFKYHGNSIIAAMGIVNLRYLDEDNARRRALAAAYEKKLSGQSNAIEIVPTPECQLHSRHLFQVLVDDRQEVIAALQADSIHPGVHYAINTAYAPYRPYARPLPRAEAFCSRVLSLPLHLDLTEADIERVSEVLLKAARRSSAAA